ncbi:hypothetical protein [Azospirillum sp. sgz302134]
MLDVLALALLISVFGGTVSHLLAAQLGAGGSTNASTSGLPVNRLRRIEKPADDEVSGPTWASFPRAF